MARSDERLVAEVVERETGTQFHGCGYSLDGWGDVDDYANLDSNRYLFLEVETKQKHPSTNVLKLWPYLEAHPETSVVLVHAFFIGSDNSGSSRGRLAKWLGDRLEVILGRRFRYCRLILEKDHSRVVSGMDELRASLLASTTPA